MSKYIDIHKKIRTFLKGTEATYPNQLILDGINAGCQAILPWIPKRKSIDITSGSDSTLELPSDVYRVEAVYSSDSGAWLGSFAMKPSVVISNTFPLWIEYPSGYLSLTLESIGVLYTVYYFSSWDELVITDFDKDTTVMDTPAYTDLAIVYYACSYCLSAAATSTAQLRQFATRTDSGNPEDNPLKDMSNLMLQRFYNEVKLMPSYERAQR